MGGEGPRRSFSRCFPHFADSVLKHFKLLINAPLPLVLCPCFKTTKIVSQQAEKLKSRNSKDEGE